MRFSFHSCLSNSSILSKVSIIASHLTTQLSNLVLFLIIRYGYEFLFETYLYHLSRQDTRHNFSPYFYALYLTGADTTADSLLLKVINFLPQVLVLLIISLYMYENLEFAFFGITFMFVTFNKVCTSQVCVIFSSFF